ncbi:component of the polarisome [Cichlidogyrus casuarinus]|uniref:Component of the polarisome n=1 Tax=Cichlidogyrus casuarinus TaxID=1844966 RepID=A0ABD2PY17_9PLAT
MEKDEDLNLTPDLASHSFGPLVCSAYVQQTMSAQLGWATCFATLEKGLSALKESLSSWNQFDNTYSKIEDLLKRLQSLEKEVSLNLPGSEEEISKELENLREILHTEKGPVSDIDNLLRTLKLDLQRLPFAKELPFDSTEEDGARVSGALGLAFKKYLDLNSSFQDSKRELNLAAERLESNLKFWDVFNRKVAILESQLDDLAKETFESHKTDVLDSIKLIQNKAAQIKFDEIQDVKRKLEASLNSNGRLALSLTLSKLEDKQEELTKNLETSKKDCETYAEKLASLEQEKTSLEERVSYFNQMLVELKESGFWNTDLETGPFASINEYTNQLKLRKLETQSLKEKIALQISRKLDQEKTVFMRLFEHTALLSEDSLEPVQSAIDNVSKKLDESFNSLQMLSNLLERLNGLFGNSVQQFMEREYTFETCKCDSLEQVSDRASTLQSISTILEGIINQSESCSFETMLELASEIDSFEWTEKASTYCKELVKSFEMQNQEVRKNYEEFAKEILQEKQFWWNFNTHCDKLESRLEAMKQDFTAFLEAQTEECLVDSSPEVVQDKITTQLETLNRFFLAFDEESSADIETLSIMLDSANSDRKVTDLKMLSCFNLARNNCKNMSKELQIQITALTKQQSIAKSIVENMSELQKLFTENEKELQSIKTENSETSLFSLENLEKNSLTKQQRLVAELRDLQLEVETGSTAFRDFFEQALFIASRELEAWVTEINSCKSSVEDNLKDHHEIRELQTKSDQTLKQLQLELRQLLETELVVPQLGFRAKENQDFWVIELINSYEILHEKVHQFKDKELPKNLAVLQDRLQKFQVLSDSSLEFQEEELTHERLLTESIKILSIIKEDLKALDLAKRSYQELSVVHVTFDEFLGAELTKLQNQKQPSGLTIEEFNDSIQNSQQKISEAFNRIAERCSQDLDELKKLADHLVHHLISTSKRRIVSTASGPFNCTTLLESIRASSSMLMEGFETRIKSLKQIQIHWYGFTDRIKPISHWIEEERRRQSKQEKHSLQSLASSFALQEIHNKLEDQSQIEINKIRECRKKCFEMNALIEVVNTFLEDSKSQTFFSSMAKLASKIATSCLANLRAIKEELNARATETEERESTANEARLKINKFKTWHKETMQQIHELENLCRETDQRKESRTRCQSLLDQVRVLQPEQVQGANLLDVSVRELERFIGSYHSDFDIKNFGITSELASELNEVQSRLAQLLNKAEKDLMGLSDLKAMYENHDQLCIKFEEKLHMFDEYLISKNLISNLISSSKGVFSPDLREFINSELETKMQSVDQLKCTVNDRILKLSNEKRIWESWYKEASSYGESLKSISEALNTLKTKEFEALSGIKLAYEETKLQNSNLEKIAISLLSHAKEGKEMSGNFSKETFKQTTKRLQEQCAELQEMSKEMLDQFQSDKAGVETFTHNAALVTSWLDPMETQLREAITLSDKEKLVELQEKIRLRDESLPVAQMKSFCEQISLRLLPEASQEMREQITKLRMRLDSAMTEVEVALNKITDIEKNKRAWSTKLSKLEQKLERLDNTLLKAFQLPSILYCDPEESLVQKVVKGSTQNRDLRDILASLEELDNDIMELKSILHVGTDEITAQRAGELISKYEKMRGNLQIYLRHSNLIWDDLNTFHLTFVEADKWLISSTLRLQYLTQIVSDGTKGLEQLRKLLIVLMNQVSKFKSVQVARLGHLSEKVKDRFQEEMVALYETFMTTSLGRDSPTWSKLSTQLTFMVNRLLEGCEKLETMIKSIEERLNRDTEIWHTLQSSIKNCQEFILVSLVHAESHLPPAERKAMETKAEQLRTNLKAALHKAQNMLVGTNLGLESDSQSSEVSTTSEFLELFPETLRLLAKIEDHELDRNHLLDSTDLKVGADILHDAESLLRQFDDFAARLDREGRRAYLAKVKWKAQLALERELDQWYVEKSREFEGIMRITSDRVERNYGSESWYRSLDQLMNTAKLDALQRKVLDKGKVLEDARCTRLLLIEELRNEQFIKEGNFEKLLAQHASLLEAIDEALILRREIRLETEMANQANTHLSRGLDHLIQRLTGLGQAEIESLRNFWLELRTLEHVYEIWCNVDKLIRENLKIKSPVCRM